MGHSQRFISLSKPSQPCNDNKTLFMLFGFDVAHQSVHIAWMNGRKKVSFSQQTQNWGWITILNRPLVFYSITTTAYERYEEFWGHSWQVLESHFTHISGHFWACWSFRDVVLWNAVMQLGLGMYTVFYYLVPVIKLNLHIPAIRVMSWASFS